MGGCVDAQNMMGTWSKVSMSCSGEPEGAACTKAQSHKRGW